MPTSEIPNPTEPTEKPNLSPRERRAARRAAVNRLDELDSGELVTLIEDLEDDRAKARVREGIWISVIVHLLIFWYLLYGPQVLFHRPRVINPSEVLAQREKDAQILDLPADALKSIRPKTNVLSDKDRVAQTAHPTLDKKTLEQLEAMKAAGPPAPTPGQPAQQQPQAPPPAPTPQQQQAQPTPPQQAQPQRPVPSLEPQQQALNNAPKPNFNTRRGSVGDQIQSAANAAARGQAGGGDFGAGAPVHHQGIQSGMEILSDTMGVDFGPYLARLKFLIEQSWYPLIPEAARPPLNKQGVTQIRFRIGPDGNLQLMHLDGRSGDTSLDRAAWGALTGATPLPPLPKDFKGPYLEIRGAFLYNIPPDQLK
jgi:outer membrane biosynthesis protein TonB